MIAAIAILLSMQSCDTAAAVEGPGYITQAEADSAQIVSHINTIYETYGDSVIVDHDSSYKIGANVFDGATYWYDMTTGSQYLATYRTDNMQVMTRQLKTRGIPYRITLVGDNCWCVSWDKLFVPIRLDI
jgi:hypothetical protein